MYAGQARLFDEKNRNVYDNLNGIDAGTILALAPQPAPPFRVGQDMSWGAEAAKRRYAQRQRPDLCMASFDLTLGYHLESAICRSCPCASECGPRTAQILKELMR